MIVVMVMVVVVVVVVVVTALIIIVAEEIINIFNSVQQSVFTFVHVCSSSNNS